MIACAMPIFRVYDVPRFGVDGAYSYTIARKGHLVKSEQPRLLRRGALLSNDGLPVPEAGYAYSAIVRVQFDGYNLIPARTQRAYNLAH